MTRFRKHGPGEPRTENGLTRWWRSERFREIGRRQCEKLNRERRAKPKCGAARKSDGEPCQRPAMANGRCVLHGGKTPKGDQWHVTQWPKKTQARATEKMNRKLRNIERDAKELQQRLASMSADEHAEYEKWKRARKPGPAAARALKRQEAKSAAEFRKFASPGKENISPEAAELRAYRLYLEAEYERLGQLIEEDKNIGAFG